MKSKSYGLYLGVTGYHPPPKKPKKKLLWTMLVLIIIILLTLLVPREATNQYYDWSEYKTVTAYNVGDTSQTDDTPCIGASNVDLCKLVKLGIPICAANFVPLGSKLKIEGYGECYVLDRMNKKYNQRVDIAFPKGDKRAKEWGIKSLKVN
jgi:3D (Asp-Asp-Asp) domain-containing protein